MSTSNSICADFEADRSARSLGERATAIAAGVGAGILVAILTRLNASLGVRIGVLESSFFVHLVGALLAFVIILRKFNREFVRRSLSLPRFLLTGGLFGVAIVFMVNIIVPILGMVVTISLLVTADLVFSTVADHFGLWGLDKFQITSRRVLGLLVACAGLLLVFRR